MPVNGCRSTGSVSSGEMRITMGIAGETTHGAANRAGDAKGNTIMPRYRLTSPPIALTYPLDSSGSEVISGVRNICAFLRIGHATLYGWIRAHGFPATRTPEGRWLTSTALIDRWILARVEAQKRSCETETKDTL